MTQVAQVSSHFLYKNKPATASEKQTCERLTVQRHLKGQIENLRQSQHLSFAPFALRTWIYSKSTLLLFTLLKQIRDYNEYT